MRIQIDKRLLVETLTWLGVALQAVRMAEESKRIYTTYKPKRQAGFAPPKRRWR